MTSTRLLTKKATILSKIYLSTICLGAICLASVVGSVPFVPSAFAQYGLGLSKSAGSGGATRGTLPQITMLAPEDGAKTLATRPTFYWYIAPPEVVSTSLTTLPRKDEGTNSFKITFILRDGNQLSAKSVFTAEGKADKSGLYKFTLPEGAPELVAGKLQRWQIRWQTNGSQVDVNAAIRRDDDPVILKAIAEAKDDLQQARIYAKNAYWYDAINAYTNWLSKNPKDDVARTERNDLLKEGFKNHSAFSKELEGNFTKLLSKLDESKSATSIVLQPKNRR